VKFIGPGKQAREREGKDIGEEGGKLGPCQKAGRTTS